MIAQHFVNQTVTDIPLAPGGPALPFTSAFMPAGNYMVEFVGYNCTAPGLYKWLVGSTIHSRIVYGGDLYALMSAISWNHAHGVADESHATWQDASNAGMTHKWRMRCGTITGLVFWYLQQVGVQYRFGNVKTLEPLNGFDDGHIMPEIFHGGKWKLWDMTNGIYFRKNGVHLSRDEVLSEGVLTCERVPIDGDEKRGSDVAGSLDMGSYRDLTFRTQAQQDAWFQRCFQAPA